MYTDPSGYFLLAEFSIATGIRSLSDMLLFIEKKFPELLKEEAGHRSAEGWHFDEHYIKNMMLFLSM